MKKLLLLAPVLLVAGCESVGGPGVSTYLDCDRGTKLKIDNLGSSAVLVSVNGDRPFAMKQVRSGSGVAYEDPRHNLRMKGNEGMWTIGRAMPENCTQTVMPR